MLEYLCVFLLGVKRLSKNINPILLFNSEHSVSCLVELYVFLNGLSSDVLDHSQFRGIGEGMMFSL